MDTPTNVDSFQGGDPRLMIRWARRYAKSRTISFLVQWVFIVIMVLSIGVAGSLTNIAYRSGNMALFSVSVVVMGLTILALTWFSVSKWGSDLIWRITQWLYGNEGYVSYSEAHANQSMPLWITALGGGLVVYHLIGALLISFGYLHLHYMQPFSAAYMVPFLAIMILYQRLGFWAWFWPVLYALHAFLLLRGFPLGFRGQWQLLDMVVSVFGCGLAAILSGHLYSRFALWKLKRLVQSGLPAENAPVSEDDVP
ncbi:MAG TPA: hypothetical protein PLI09_25080 [Candidatus Hydrogenedentes bacterium]|nr:hypothetical protein [Candidatus Hydrogenedentota bacterium]